MAIRLVFRPEKQTIPHSDSVYRVRTHSREFCIPVSDKKRFLLIALNATLELEREVICHLARHLDLWWHLDDSCSLPRDVQSLRLSKKILTKARHLVCNPDAVAARELHRAQQFGATIVTLVEPRQAIDGDRGGRF